MMNIPNVHDNKTSIILNLKLFMQTVCKPSANNSSSLGSKLISSNVPTYDFYLRELLRSELTYLLTLHDPISI